MARKPAKAPAPRENLAESLRQERWQNEFLRESIAELRADPLMRIAICGYDGEHKTPRGWYCLPWKTRGGYGSQGKKRGRANAGLERIWFSPHCLN